MVSTLRVANNAEELLVTWMFPDSGIFLRFFASFFHGQIGFLPEYVLRVTGSCVLAHALLGTLLVETRASVVATLNRPS